MRIYFETIDARRSWRSIDRVYVRTSGKGISNSGNKDGKLRTVTTREEVGPVMIVNNFRRSNLTLATPLISPYVINKIRYLAGKVVLKTF